MNLAAFFFSILLSLALVQCQRPNAVTVKQESPEATLNSVFELARAAQVSPLHQLCDPLGRNDGDTDCLCALSPIYTPHTCSANSHNRLLPAAFFKCFATAEISGEVVYLSETAAQLPFRANRQYCGFANETMNLIYENQRWYLEGF